jgi:hypothetical protein
MCPCLIFPLVYATFQTHFISGVFLIVPKLHHNAAEPKPCSRNLLIWMDLVGAWRFELQASCAQGKRQIAM